MPTYEYECKKSGKKFEFFQDMKDKPLETCPDCGGPVRRLISSGAGLIFKGEGFYSTDYKNKGVPPAVPECGRSSPCCGRETPCDTPGCKK